MPRAAAKPKCIRGHVHPAGWTPTWGCHYCDAADAKALAGLTPEQYREARRKQLGVGPPPDVMTMRTHDGAMITFRSRPRRRR